MSRSVVLAAHASALFVTITVLAATGATAAFDAALLEIVRDPELGQRLGVLRTLTTLGGTEFIVVAGGAALVIGWATGRSRLGALAATTIGAAALANAMLKAAIARVRPDLMDPGAVVSGFSFPSGHALLSTVAYGILAAVLWRSKFATLYRALGVGMLVLVVALVGVSRVYLGVHYPTDVLAGWTGGLILVLAFSALTRRLQQQGGAGPMPADSEV